MAGASSVRERIAVPLRQPNFRWYFLSETVNTAGTSMSSVALAFAVLSISNSPESLGIVLAASMVPMVLLLLLGGVAADRLPRVLIIRAGNVLVGILEGIAAALVITGHATIPALAVLMALSGVVLAVLFPAIQGLFPQLVPRGVLQEANQLQSIVRGVFRILGPTIAALLVVGVGPGWALGADALTWLVAAGLMLPVRLPPRAARAPEPIVSALREGWTLFRKTTWLWGVVVAFGMLNAIHSGAWFTLGPVRAKQTFGEQGWGLVLSAESIGLLVATAVLLRVGLRRPLLAGMVGIAFVGPALVLLGADPSLTVLVPAAALAGAGTEVFSLGWQLAMQENIEERLLSRASSYDALGSFVAIPVGQAGYGFLAAWFGFTPVLVVSGVVYTALALGTLGSRSIRTLRRA